LHIGQVKLIVTLTKIARIKTLDVDLF
jgi:hypothetical protein